MHPFEIVAEPVRRRIIEVLAVGEHEVSVLNDVIATEFAVTRSAVSHHLRIMRDEGVVDFRGDGAQGRLYALNMEYLEQLDHAVGELFWLWDHRYGSLYRRAPIHPAPVSRTPHRLGRKGMRGRRPAADADADADATVDPADLSDPATPPTSPSPPSRTIRPPDPT